MSRPDPSGGTRKAALLLVTLGADICAELLRHLKPSEVDRLTAEIACLDSIDPGEKFDALRAFCAHMNENRGNEVCGEADPALVLELVGSEHPQTIALVLSRMEPEGAAFVMRNLPAAMQSDIARRIASIDSAAPETVRTVKRVLETRIRHRSRNESAASESFPTGTESGRR